MQLITMGEFNKSTKIMDYYAISAEDHTGGGIIGGLSFMHLPAPSA